MVKQNQVYLIPSIVKFGVKQLKCRRQGICEIREVESLLEAINPLHNASYALLLINEQRVLSVHFWVSSMTENTREKYFRNNVFSIMMPFTFDLILNDTVHTYQINAGDYKYQTVENYYTLSFQYVNTDDHTIADDYHWYTDLTDAEGIWPLMATQIQEVQR